jgi:hypothetical protein
MCRWEERLRSEPEEGVRSAWEEKVKPELEEE